MSCSGRPGGVYIVFYGGGISGQKSIRVFPTVSTLFPRVTGRKAVTIRAERVTGRKAVAIRAVTSDFFGPLIHDP